MMARKGQTTEKELYENELGWADFDEFLDFLGKKLTSGRFN